MSSSSGVQNALNSSLNSGAGLSSLQAMGGAMGSAGNLSVKDSLNALLAQTVTHDPQTFIKQQQKMMQCLPPAQRKIYENMLADVEQAMKMT